MEHGESVTRSVVFGEGGAAPAGGGATPQEDQQEMERETDADEEQPSSVYGQGINGPLSISSEHEEPMPYGYDYLEDDEKEPLAQSG